MWSIIDQHRMIVLTAMAGIMLIVIMKRMRRKRQRESHNHQMSSGNQTSRGRDLGTSEHLVKETNSVISGVYILSISAKITTSKHSSVDKTGSRDFPICGPALWNALPVPIRNARTSKKHCKFELWYYKF